MSELEVILSLHENMSALDAARARLAGVPDWMLELHDEHSAKKAEIEIEEAAAVEATRLRREAEAEVADHQEKLKRYQQQISQVTTQREYGALLKEIDTAKGQIKDLEEKALEALESHEAAVQKAEEMREGFQDLDQRYQAELEKWEEEKPGVEALTRELEAKLEELRANVPRSLFSQFQRIRERTGGMPVARVGRLQMARTNNAMWHCMACNFNVRPQIL
ncbi:MAG: hypothetical protein AAGN66_02400, partial [Acidobacteriota bacterium]